MITIVPLPALEDNYIWLLHNDRFAVAVDPGDEAPVLDYLTAHGLRLAAIFNTHHHADHVGGNAALIERFDIPVYGPRRERIATVNRAVGEGDEIDIPELGGRFAVLDIPGHTAGHIAYYDADSVFCGDTLFGCGCGRLFEGTPVQMHESLEKLRRLPDHTAVCCAHEYTLANIRFALTVEPENSDLLARRDRDAKARAEGRATLPSSIGLEKLTNPFLRYAEPSVIDAAQRRMGHPIADPVAVFATIRAWKDRF